MTRQHLQRKRLKVGVVDLFANPSSTSLYARILNPNLLSIMPQVVAAWTEQMGHEVYYLAYTGVEDLHRELQQHMDIVFFCAFTRTAFLAYSLSNLLRKRNIITVLGGPHARAYAEDAKEHFDYVVALADRPLVEDLLRDASPNVREGVIISADQQPHNLPGVKERWKFIQGNLFKSRVLHFVPMIGSLGCPYKCHFCIDSQVDYQPLCHDQIREDLLFLQRLHKPPRVSWYDPNFGVRANEYMDIIESTVRPGKLEFAAESSLSMLTESTLKRMKGCGFVVMLPGIESWFDFNQKTIQNKNVGPSKVKDVAERVALVTRYMRYVQANFIFGLDSDMGPAPFELTKQFIDLVPGVFPNYQFITAYGNSAPLNYQYQYEDRVMDIPFNFLDSHFISNVRLKNYTPTEFYDYFIGLWKYSFSPPRLWKAFKANQQILARCMNLLRMMDFKKHAGGTHLTIRNRYVADPEFQAFYSGRSIKPPTFFVSRLKAQIGSFYESLPPKVLNYLEQGGPVPNPRISGAITSQIQFKGGDIPRQEIMHGGSPQL